MDQFYQINPYYRERERERERKRKAKLDIGIVYENTTLNDRSRRVETLLSKCECEYECRTLSAKCVALMSLT
jgi:hypothetical protein